MRTILIFGCLVGTVLYLIAVFLGLFIAFKTQTIANWTVSLVGALLILCLMLSTEDIMSKADGVHRCIRVFWVMGLAAGAYTLYLSAFRHIILGAEFLSDIVPVANTDSADRPQLMIMWFSIVTTAAAPIAISYLWKFVRLKRSNSDADGGLPHALRS